MANDKLTLQEIKDKILDFNLDESINDLKKYYATPTTWEIIKQSRRETSHTQFLAWFFDNKDFNADPNAGPIKKLIVLLLKWANKQKKAQFDNDLAESIYQQNFSIISSKAVPEYGIIVGQVSDSNVRYGEGDIDIFITVKADINGTQRTIHIVIENKINAPETTKSFDKDGNLLKKPTKEVTETTLYQTDAYYQYMTDIFKDDINLFVYLKPTDCSLDEIKEAECNNKTYIQINYQELLDYIIQPVSEQKDISIENAYRLKDYIKALGKPSETDDEKADDKQTSNKKIIIMAMEQEERELLNKFFDNNEDLIRAAINAIGDKKLSQSMANIPKGRASRTYSISNRKERFTMYEVLEEFIKYRYEAGVTIDNIDNEIRSYLGKRSTRVNVSADPQKMVHRENVHKGEIKIDGMSVRYTKEWGGDENGNFTKFKNAVNAKNDPDFQINEIQ